MNLKIVNKKGYDNGLEWNYMIQFYYDDKPYTLTNSGSMDCESINKRWIYSGIKEVDGWEGDLAEDELLEIDEYIVALLVDMVRKFENDKKLNEEYAKYSKYIKL